MTRLPPDRPADYCQRERLCSRCREWWPATLDYFYRPSRTRGTNAISRWCRACFADARRVADARRRAVPRAGAEGGKAVPRG